MGEITWELAVASLQHLMKHPAHVGGGTALELQGCAHFLTPSQPHEIELQTDEPLPGWLYSLFAEQNFLPQRPSKLFSLDQLTPPPADPCYLANTADEPGIAALTVCRYPLAASAGQAVAVALRQLRTRIAVTGVCATLVAPGAVFRGGFG